MKRIFFCLFFLTASLTAAAQQVTELRRSRTIFAFEEFQPAKIIQPFGRVVREDVNIFLKDASLCFLRDGKIYTADVSHVIGVKFDSVEYKNVNNQMGRVIGSHGSNHLVCVTTIDAKRNQEETTGGTNMPFFEILPSLGPGLFIDLDLEPLREYEKGLPLKDTYYFIVKGQIVPAKESKFKKFVRPEMKQAFKTLMGDRFWSWRDPESLRKLFMYL